jgi:glycosyltransferase involved in cell wall biosynthesis
MKISIAMATYNGSKYLEQQLESFLIQTRPPDELVVCDDSSTDCTVAILQKFRQKALFTVSVHGNDKNIGYMRNFEKALSLCSGNLIFLSDQDDAWDRDKISKVLSVFIQTPNINLIINDARYADENLNPSGITVLQNVLSVSGRKNNHIGGSCTAISSRFRDFVVPFPKNNCPAHDVYIHRWANLIGGKLVVQDVLQSWRRHGQNSTNTEMCVPKIHSTIDRYKAFKHVDATGDYIQKANEFREMDAIACERGLKLSAVAVGFQRAIIRRNIRRIIKAHLNRARLSELNWITRKKIILFMALTGQYKYFYGLKSVAKDLLR